MKYECPRPQQQKHHHLILVCLTLFVGLVGCLAITDATTTSTTITNTASTTSSASKSSIPRTVELPGASLNGENIGRSHFPPWNPSPQIDANGFLISKYRLIPGEWERDGKQKRRRRRPPSSSSTTSTTKHNPKELLSTTPTATIRQVPGDGNCLFHSISTCYAHVVNGTHIDLRNPSNLQWLYQQSARFRQLAVDCLEGEFHKDDPNRQYLFLHGQDYLTCRDLVEAAAAPYGISGKEYCHLMRQNSYWGGGPEIVALCNVLQRPIHVYELHVPQRKKKTPTPHTTSSKPSKLAFLFPTKRKQQHEQPQQRKNSKEFTSTGSDSKVNNAGPATSSASSLDDSPSFFVLRRMACFGSPKFDKQTPLHILSVDSRFPDISPGKQLASGNHFMALFPHDNCDIASKKKTRIRGGAGWTLEEDDSLEEYENDDENMGWWSRFWSFW
jgi:hypothetical protein